MQRPGMIDHVNVGLVGVGGALACREMRARRREAGRAYGNRSLPSFDIAIVAIKAIQRPGIVHHENIRAVRNTELLGHGQLRPRRCEDAARGWKIPRPDRRMHAPRAGVFHIEHGQLPGAADREHVGPVGSAELPRRRQRLSRRVRHYAEWLHQPEDVVSAQRLRIDAIGLLVCAALIPERGRLRPLGVQRLIPQPGWLLRSDKRLHQTAVGNRSGTGRQYRPPGIVAHQAHLHGQDRRQVFHPDRRVCRGLQIIEIDRVGVCKKLFSGFVIGAEGGGGHAACGIGSQGHAQLVLRRQLRAA